MTSSLVRLAVALAMGVVCIALLVRWRKSESVASCQELESVKKITDEQIHNAVEKLFLRETDYEAEGIVQAAGKRATPALVAALRDVPRVTQRFGKDGDFVHPHSPLGRIEDLIGREHLPDVVEPLTNLSKHEDDRMRVCAVLALGVLASPDCIAPITKALEDPDEYVAGAATTGMRRAIESDRFDREFLDAVFPTLQRRLRNKELKIDKRMVRLMLSIDRDRTMPILLADDVFNVENPKIYPILDALNEEKIGIDPARLSSFLQRLKPLAVKHPWTSAYAEALIAYGRNPDAGAGKLLRAELRAEDDRVQTAAAEGLALLSGVVDPYRFVYQRMEEVGFEGLTVPQQHYLAVWLCDTQIRNGGMSSYFVNSYAEHWREALAGFKAIGAPEHQQLLRQAVDLFGSRKPKVVKKYRLEQLRAFTPEQSQALDDLSDPYFKSKENIKTLLAEYTIDHKEHFQK